MIKNNKYRPDIDGLRSIAVISVMLHHLNDSLLPGGFVGVDIFFVISGYLITSHICKELRDGTFTFKQFYARRINRIVPALITVTIASIMTGIFLLSPDDLILLTKSAIYTILGFSNIFFWREYGNYFAYSTNEAPLLHTWSLGVEEQFYFVWPFFLLILTRLNKHWKITITFAILTIGAIIISEVITNNFTSASYYLIPSRFFELMLGGLLSFTIKYNRHFYSFQSSQTFSYILGYLLIGTSLLCINKNMPFPGISALYPCLGTALLIWAGSNQKTHPLSKLLTNSPMVFIGLISYSIYLWHWPIIAYLNYTQVNIDLINGACVIFLSIIISYLSWKYIELPLRKPRANLLFGHFLWWRYIIHAMILTTIGIITFYNHGFPKRFDSRVTEIEKIIKLKPNLLRFGCHVPSAMYNTQPKVECKLGSNKPQIDGFLIGDSFANHFSGMVDIMSNSANISVMDYTMDGCPPIFMYSNGTKTYAERCLKRNNSAYENIKKNKYNKVILASRWPTTTEAGLKLISSIEIILKSGAALTIIINNVEIEHANSCPIKQIMYGKTYNCSGPHIPPPQYFKEIRILYPQINIIDPNEAICNKDTCYPMLNGIPLYRDSSHLNDAGSRLIGQKLLNSGIKL